MARERPYAGSPRPSLSAAVMPSPRATRERGRTGNRAKPTRSCRAACIRDPRDRVRADLAVLSESGLPKARRPPRQSEERRVPGNLQTTAVARIQGAGGPCHGRRPDGEPAPLTMPARPPILLGAARASCPRADITTIHRKRSPHGRRRSTKDNGSRQALSRLSMARERPGPRYPGLQPCARRGAGRDLPGPKWYRSRTVRADVLVPSIGTGQRYPVCRLARPGRRLPSRGAGCAAREAP